MQILSSFYFFLRDIDRCRALFRPFYGLIGFRKRWVTVTQKPIEKKHLIERHIIGKIVSCVLTKAPRVFFYRHFRTIVDILFNRFHTVLLTRYAIVLTNSDRIHWEKITKKRPLPRRRLPTTQPSKEARKRVYFKYFTIKTWIKHTNQAINSNELDHFVRGPRK